VIRRDYHGKMMSFALAFFLVYQLACIGLVMWCRVARSRSRPWVVIDVPVVMLPSYLMVFCLSRPCLPRLMHSTMQCVRYRLGLPAGSLSNRGLGGSSPQPGRVISPLPSRIWGKDVVRGSRSGSGDVILSSLTISIF
jgi:hypothetical protein